MKNKIFKNNKIKIIAGILKSQVIKIQQNCLLKPTKNIVKETLFNWISNNIKNSKCLDCFAGSGSLGIEAISRSARFVTFIESNVNIVKKLIANLIRLNIYYKAKVIQTNILEWIQKKGHPYDIIFIDPPFNQKIVNIIINYLDKNNWTHNYSLIYIEQLKNKKKLRAPLNWFVYKQKTSGNVLYYLILKDVNKNLK
ncbi:ribosomal RNA small subunit methyltransferase D [Buchnera aphidicola (Nipponaphis monzeni)]|uniref:Ribosomal RNA small subunit methyltransferase D n=1 Tax=Buchnera aphidicola (Nipponaphis monzeni) TaxID=2495405 RepID=A0A455T9N6_9GAMM|nr:16S rRNA (guanine(966)-N(2))-methyltransferase RsmD [Buchnera aphidicola]BBI01040.1 ribosomal RNA small subunit methyltransferase D [Buchnera aphidicola (Nipponaphis monzeni)]